MGRWLGPAHNAGQGLAYYILTDNGEVVMRSTVVPLTGDELSSPPIQERKSAFTKQVEEVIGNYSKAASDFIPQKPMDDKDIYHHLLFDADDHSEDLLVQEIDPEDLPIVMPSHDNIANLDAPCTSLKDTLLGAEVTLPTSDGYVEGEVKHRKVDPSTKLLIGTHNHNPKS